MDGYTREEAADRAGISVATLDRLVALQFIAPASPEGFSPGDIRRAMVVQSFVAAGLPLDELVAVFKSQDSLPNLDFLDTPAYERLFAVSDVTFHQLSARTGVPIGVLKIIREVSGSPSPEPDDRVGEGELAVVPFIEFSLKLGASEEGIERLLRMYGDALHRVAESEAAMYREEILAPLVAAGGWSTVGSFEANEGGTFTDLMDTARTAVLHTQQAHAWVGGIVEFFEQVLAGAGLHSRLERPPAMCFLDLTGYTRLTAERGDAAAAALAADLERLVHRESVKHGGRPVKWLGDGVMFHFPDPGPGVVAALEMSAGVTGVGLPPAHVGLHAGPVIFQAGDYYGQTVNIASRIAEYARPGEVLVSQAVVDAAGDELPITFADIGEVELKGVAGSLHLHAAHKASGQ